MQWVLSSIVKATLLGWDGSFVGKKRKGVGEQALYVFFGWFGRQGTKLLLRKKSCQSKDLRILLYLVRDKTVYKIWFFDFS